MHKACNAALLDSFASREPSRGERARALALRQRVSYSGADEPGVAAVLLLILV